MHKVSLVTSFMQQLFLAFKKIFPLSVKTFIKQFDDISSKKHLIKLCYIAPFENIALCYPCN